MYSLKKCYYRLDGFDRLTKLTAQTNSTIQTIDTLVIGILFINFCVRIGEYHEVDSIIQIFVFI